MEWKQKGVYEGDKLHSQKRMTVKWKTNYQLEAQNEKGLSVCARALNAWWRRNCSLSDGKCFSKFGGVQQFSCFNYTEENETKRENVHC